MSKFLTIAFAFFLSTILCFQYGYCQQPLTMAQTERRADSLYRVKEYQKAINDYTVVAQKSDFPGKLASTYYNIACCYSLAGKVDSALITLKQAIKAGYENKAHLSTDTDLVPLHKHPDWTNIVNRVPESKPALNTDPTLVNFVTADIHNFWNAYDHALKDTAHFRQIVKREYFDRASKGMNDYMSIKVSSIDFFVQHIRSAPAFYSAIRKNTLKADDYKPDFLASYVKFKALYPDALFPDVYFMIGALTSGGTVSNTGLLLGINQAAQDGQVPVNELSSRQQTRLNSFKTLPNLVAHELIHFQQNDMKRDTTTLSAAIKEGMADFIGELISGNTANSILFTWAKGKEQEIWNRFTKDMDYNRYGNWIANSQQATADNLPDQGYWVGYQICKAYYQEAKDKKQAIYDMLHLQDYKQFLEKSKWESKVAAMRPAN